MKTNIQKVLMGILFMLIGLQTFADTAATAVDCTGMKAIQEKIDEDPTANVTANITFEDKVYVTAVYDKKAYATDGTYGVIIYDNYSLFKKGDIITGTKAEVTLCMVDGAYAIKGIINAEGLTVTRDNELTPALLTINSVTKANTGRYVTLKSVTYTVEDGAGTITDPDKKHIYCLDGLDIKPGLTSGTMYDMTGIISYTNALAFYPITVTTAPEREPIATKTAFSGVTNSKVNMTYGEQIEWPTATVSADGVAIADAEVTYTSSNANVIKFDNAGDFSILGCGSTDIIASYAGNGTFAASSGKYTLTIKAECAYISDMQGTIDKNPLENIPAALTFTNVRVTAKHGNWAYVSDGTCGIMIYDEDNALKTGNVISGEIPDAILCLNNSAYAIKDFSTDKLTITDGETLSPTETTISSIQKKNLCEYVTVKNVTYGTDGDVHFFIDSDGNKITYADDLETAFKFTDDYKYDVTGIVGYYNGVTLVPTEVTTLTKEAYLDLNEKGSSGIYIPASDLGVGGTDTYQVYYEGDGTVSVTSSNPDVVSVVYDATTQKYTLTGISKGHTVITISATKGEEYAAATPYTYYLKCYSTDHESTRIFLYSDEDIQGKGTDEATAWSVSRYVVNLKFDNAKGRGKDIAVFGNSNVTATANEGYIVTKVELTLTNASTNTGTWVAADNTALTTAYGVISWTGFAPSVTLTNTGMMASLSDVSVTYLKLTDTGNTVTITEAGKGTYCATANCVVGDGTVTKYITGTEENGTTLTETDAAVIAEGEGVLLNGKAGEYKVYTHSLLAPTKNESNKLVGCSEATSVPAGAYVMQNQTSGVAFYIVTDADPITCPAGKAYLKDMSSQSKALFFSDSETTGIDNIGADTASDDIYTLSGVKVNPADMTKGIYIKNGKKFIVK